MSTSASMEILAQKYIPYAEMLAKIGNNAVFIVDKDEHYYFISDKFKLFGYDDIPQNNSNEIQDYPLKRRIHPDDLAMKELIDEKIYEFLSSLPKEEQVHYKYIYDYRGMATDGTYGRVTNEMQRLEVTDDNYLALGIIEIAPDQSENLPVRVQMKHCITGEVIPIKIEEEDAFALTPREKEILTLASQGFSSKEIAEKLLRSKLAKGAKTLGLATGSSPLSFYKELIESDIDLSDLVSVNLDEYVGLEADDPQSYHYFMNENLFSHKPFKKSFLPNGKAEDAEEETAAYNRILAENPVDFQILGIGTNGHIGFNEPGTSFESQTHLVDLTPSTIEANARFFETIDQVPTQAISMGIANIMAAKSIVLFAYGKGKAQAIAGTVAGPVTEELPASVLQRHEDVTIIADAEALSLLDN